MFKARFAFALVASFALGASVSAAAVTAAVEHPTTAHASDVAQSFPTRLLMTSGASAWAVNASLGEGFAIDSEASQ